jgi:hypothetical protein
VALVLLPIPVKAREETTVSKPKKLDRYPEQSYPSLDQAMCDRRGFLRRMIVGAAAATVGGRILAACTSTTDISGALPEGELHTVRLPGEGLGGAYVRPDGWEYDAYVTFAVTFTTRDRTLADLFREDETTGLGVCSATLSSYTCPEIETNREAVASSIRAALEDGFREMTGREGGGILSLELMVDSCQGLEGPGGVVEEPYYP